MLRQFGSRLAAAIVFGALALAMPAAAAERAAARRAALTAKAKAIVIPVFAVDGWPVPTVLDFLKTRSRELDPEGVGINFVLVPPLVGPDALAQDATPTVTLERQDITVLTAVREVCAAAKLEYRIDDCAILIGPPDGRLRDLELRCYRPPPQYAGKDNAAVDWRQVLRERGVELPPTPDADSGAVYFHQFSGKLIVCQPPAVLAQIQEKLRLPVTPGPPTPEVTNPAVEQAKDILERIVIPRIVFEDTPVTTVLDFIKTMSREHDPHGAGGNVLGRLRWAPEAPPGAAPAAPPPDDVAPGEPGTTRPRVSGEPTVTLDWDQVTLGAAFRYLGLLSGLGVSIDARGTLCLDYPPRLETERFRIGEAAVTEATQAAGGDLRQWLETLGVEFPAHGEPPAAATYERQARELVVTTTRDNLERSYRIVCELGEPVLPADGDDLPGAADELPPVADEDLPAAPAPAPASATAAAAAGTPGLRAGTPWPSAVLLAGVFFVGLATGLLAARLLHRT